MRSRKKYSRLIANSFLRSASRFWSVCLFVLYLLLGVTAEAQESHPLFFIYHGEQRMLSLDAKHVAVHAGDSAAFRNAFPAGLAANGLEPSDITAVPLEGWIILNVEKVVAPVTNRAGPGVNSATDQPQAESVHALIVALLNSGDPSIEFVSPVFRDERGGPILLTPTVLIGFKESFTASERARLLGAVPEGAQLIETEFPQPHDVRWRINSRDGFAVLARANALAQTEGIAYAEPNMVVTGYTNYTPNDPSFAQSWGLRNIGQSGGQSGFDMGATTAWDTTLGSSSVIVLVMDSGIQQDHPDLNQVAGRDFTTDANSNPNGGPIGSNDNHGTAVAGCISERANNSIGSTGVAPGTRVASARIGTNYQVQDDGSVSFSAEYTWFADALYWGQSIGVRVSNNSNSLGGTSSALESAYSSTRTNGMVHFASAGNGSVAQISYPARLSTVNSVAAANRFGQRSGFSQYGTGLDFTAPGEDVFTTDRTDSNGYSSGDYTFARGTSFASPYAAGVAALIISQNPTLTAAQVESAMAGSCTDMGADGYDTDYGYGLVNASRALSSRLPNLAPHQPAGWSNKIVVSKVTNTTTDSVNLASTDTLYLDWAVINNGNASATATFSVQLFVDGVLRTSWPVSPPTNVNVSRQVLDYNLGSLAPGTHTLRIKADSGNAVGESDEYDNEYTKTITIGNNPLPNLTPYQPSGWSDKIVVSRVTGTNSDGPTLTSTDTLYLDWAVINNSSADITTSFVIQLYVDNVLRASWTASPPTDAHYYRYVRDYNLGMLGVGTHTVRIRADSSDAISETNESDNEYSRTFTVNPPDRPNLTPFQPAEWSGKIVVSNVGGTTLDSPILRPTDQLYVDWALLNNGNADISADFITELYVDGVLKARWTSPPPTNVNYYRYVRDFNIGTLAVGSHTIRIRGDSTNVVSETSETDNEFTKTITVVPPAAPISNGAVVGLIANANGRYVVAENAGGNPLIANRTVLSSWEQFQILDLGNGYIALRSLINGRYVCAENAGASPLIANRTAVGTWEQFQAVDAGSGNFALIARANGKYVCADSGGSSSLIANRTAIAGWEQFRLVFFPSVKPVNVILGLQSASGRYVVAENAGGAALAANRDSLGAWEHFRLVDAGNGNVGLQSVINGRYVTAESAGANPLIANRTAIGPWEQFQILDVGSGFVALRATVNNRYVSSAAAGGVLIANRLFVGPAEQFAMNVTLRSQANGQYVAAGQQPLIANRPSIEISEQFQIVNTGDGFFALKAKANGQYVCAENAGQSPLIANRTGIGGWEQFEWIVGGNGTVALKAFVNGMFVCAENSGQSPLIANRPSAGNWEQFR